MINRGYSPSLEDFKKAMGDGNVIAVSRDILADTETPVSAFMKIDDGQEAFLLESVEHGEKVGRFSFLGVAPRAVIRGKGKGVEITDKGVKTIHEGDPLAVVSRFMSRFRPARETKDLRFAGGAIGCIGYDAVRHIEKLPELSRDDLLAPDVFFMLTDTFLVFDNLERGIKVISTVYLDDTNDPETLYKEAIGKIESLIARLRGTRLPAPSGAAEGRLEVSSNFSREGFLDAVKKTKGYVYDGDIIQAVISQRFEAPLKVPQFDVYRALRVINPSPYMFFLRMGDICLAGSSPEILVSCDGREVTVRPIAGTRRRGVDDAEDRALEEELLADPKERAEHIMLVDLGRNDVGRVAVAGTVRVDELMVIERYSHVMHIVSNVRGALKAGLGSFDALRACFPAGTLTGAPKVRAMEIIEELEPTRRGVYGGSVGYIGFTGAMDMAITIRTVLMKGGRLYVQAGAGVVADSVPEREYDETVNKAKGMLKAVELAMEGLF